MSTTPATATRSEFARLQGWKPSYVTELATTGRLVLSPDGKRVLVPESLERIAATRDPARLANTQRHAAARAEAMAQPQPAPESTAQAYQPPPSAPSAPDPAGSSYQQARAVKERYQALDAKRAYEVAIGQLRDAREVEHAVATAFTEVRLRLENLASTLAPTMAAITTEEAARAELQTQFEHALASLSQHLAAMGDRPAH